jgi:hypothetical protein
MSQLGQRRLGLSLIRDSANEYLATSRRLQMSGAYNKKRKRTDTATNQRLRIAGILEAEVRGQDVAGARDLAERDKHEFQKWITANIGAQPYKGGKKGMDRGIDGCLHLRDADNSLPLCQSKAERISIRPWCATFKGTMERGESRAWAFPDVE